ncbi:MAG: glycosyltransferase family 4 protein [bacterium]
MKLLFISGDIALIKGQKGPFYYLLQEFSKYWERIDIICPRVDADEIDRQFLHPFPNVFIHPSPWHLIFQPLFIVKKGKEIYQKEKFDLFGIHSYPPFYNEMGGLKLFKKIKVPFVLECHHIVGYPRSADLKEKIYLFLTKIFLAHYAKKATAVRVVNSIQVPDFLKSIGVDAKKIMYVPSFYIDFETFWPDELVDKKYDLVFCSRLVGNKGIINLVKAVKIAQLEIPDIKLMIIGSGPLQKKIEQFVKKNKLASNILFSGWLNTIEDVADVYRRSRVFVMPSYNEGGPRVTLEAMACGLPVITTRVGIMNEIIQDDENGYFVDWSAEDMAEKIIKILNHPELIKEMGEKALASVKVFNREEMIKNYAEKLIAMIKK